MLAKVMVAKVVIARLAAGRTDWKLFRIRPDGSAGELSQLAKALVPLRQRTTEGAP